MPDRLRAKDLIRPFHGIRASAAVPASSVAERCAQLLPRLAPWQFFSHTTAAMLWGIPLPWGAASGPLHVSATPPAREPRTKGVVGHRLAVDAAELTVVNGMPLPSPAETWAQLAGMVGADALIVAADHLLTRGLATIDELAASVSPGRRGAVALRRALREARTGAESPKETETRLVLVRGGLPEPELNGNLLTANGRFLARLDLVYRRYKVCVEYDGRQHAEADQFRRDADRWAAIEAEGWIIVRVLSHHLADPRGIVARTRRALESRGWSAG